MGLGLILFFARNFFFVLQVRLAIAEKGLHCEEYDVSLPLSEHNEPWFMRLNPTGEVPVLVHNDNVICDPTQIMDYLEQNFNDGETEKKAMFKLCFEKHKIASYARYSYLPIHLACILSIQLWSLLNLILN